MKFALFISIACCALSVSFGLRATILECLKIVPSWSDIDCTPHHPRLFAEFDDIWAGKQLEVIAQWLDNPIPEDWTPEELLDYCIYRECHTNQAMVDYMFEYGYPPYCMTQSSEDWMNDRYWSRCKVVVNQTLELTPEDYSTYFCYKVFHQQDPAIPCEPFEEIMNPNHPTVQELQKSHELFIDDAEPESEQWWISLMRDIKEKSVDEDHVESFHYGWIINMDANDYKNMVPLWSPYQGPTVPARRDFPRIIDAMLNHGGNITLGDFRHFECIHYEGIGSQRCREFGPLHYEPREMIVLVPTLHHILMGMTQHLDKVVHLERALLLEAQGLILSGY
uniref:Luciferase 1 n=1 Tax=Odontosyllis octodentata TaxID=2336528 RepID=A0A5A4PWC0_9ANNE|nr:luciferase 1 [Odontosyllis octodentata]